MIRAAVSIRIKWSRKYEPIRTYMSIESIIAWCVIGAATLDMFASS